MSRVEMRSDSFRGHSEGIRTTRRLPEHFPKGFTFYERCLCIVTRKSSTHALLVRDCSLVTRAGKSKGSTPHSFYHQALRTTRGCLHATVDAWCRYRQCGD